MRAVLQKQVEGLDEQLNELFTDLRQYSHEQLNQQPAPDSWCVTQVLNHLMLSEKYSRQYCEKKLSYNPTLPKVGIADKLRATLLHYYFALPLKAKAPKPVSTNAFPRESQLEELREAYEAQRKELSNFLSTIDDTYLDKAVYKHPFAGRLSLSGMLHFIEDHFAHHRKQIYQTLQQTSKSV